MKDTHETFGPISILFHWTMAVCYIGLFGLGWYMVTLDYYDPMYTKLPEIHKSIGVLFMLAFPLHLIWRTVNQRPLPLAQHKRWETTAAAVTHWTLRLGVILVLVTGYLIPTAEGAGIAVFSWFEIPATITSIPQQEDNAGILHRYAAYCILGLAMVHALAALKHHMINRDNTLTRMLGFSRRNHP